MKKLKNILVALCLCVCVGFGCFALTGCADSKTQQELEDLRTQVETLESENETLKNNNDSLEAENVKLSRDWAVAKLYESYLYTADWHNTNEINEYGYDTIIPQDWAMLMGDPLQFYTVLDLELNKEYIFSLYNDPIDFEMSIIVDGNKITYLMKYSPANNPEMYSYRQQTVTLDDSGNISSIEYIEEQGFSEGSADYNRTYTEITYTVTTNNQLENKYPVDSFETISFNFQEDSLGALSVTELGHANGTYDKILAYAPNYLSGYTITELRQYNKNIEVDGSLTVDETLSLEQASAYLNEMKEFYDTSLLPSEDITALIESVVNQ